MLHALVLGASALGVEFQTSNEAPIFLLEGAQPASMLEGFAIPMPDMGDLVSMVNKMNQELPHMTPRRPTNPCDEVRRATTPRRPRLRSPRPDASAPSTTSLPTRPRPYPTASLAPHHAAIHPFGGFSASPPPPSTSPLPLPARAGHHGHWLP